MNPLNYFPKTIDVSDYVGRFDTHLLSEGSKAHLALTNAFNGKDQFRLSYTMYSAYEGGAVAYLPFTEDDIKDAEENGYLYGSFNGGFIGDDVDLLVEHMGRWLVENGFM